MWSGPRNISTALMYSFAQRTDTTVFDEPLYAHYLSSSNANEYHPGAEDILKDQENNGGKVLEMMMGKHESPVVFFKNMTHHLLNLDRTFMKDAINVILTRDPVEMLPSFDKVIENPSMDDVGYSLHIDLVSYFKENGITPIVLDAKQVLLNPEMALKKLCVQADIPFQESMLSWSPGARKEDGIWAEYWYDSVHKSKGFMEYRPKTNTFPEHLKPLLEDCKICYQQLIALSQ